MRMRKVDRLFNISTCYHARRREALLAVTALQPAASVSRPAGALRRQARLLGRPARGPVTSFTLRCQARAPKPPGLAASLRRVPVHA
jgi:hypothetical protein